MICNSLRHPQTSLRRTQPIPHPRPDILLPDDEDAAFTAAALSDPAATAARMCAGARAKPGWISRLAVPAHRQRRPL